MPASAQAPIDWSNPEPFVLVEDGVSGSARLFVKPTQIVECHHPEEVRASLESIEGRHAAGFIAYEAGLGLEDKLASLWKARGEADPPLVWFGLFPPPSRVEPTALLPDPAGAWCGRPRPLVERAVYEERVGAVLQHILAGDIYQANLTVQAEVAVAGHPAALYAGLRQRARAGHGALAFTGRHWILSLSPESFFALEGRQVSTRPMKGTAPAGSDPAELSGDPKQRAENLMIVDLIRNDLSRVARPGSVEVPELFVVEAYPTLLQMVSAVTAELEEGVGPAGLLQAVFPCGSITGAPKIRAMQLLAGLEDGPRGVYCGAIGRVAPDGDAAFNVAIRTLTLPAGGRTARLGLGSGIVADSRPADEWTECLTKGAFVQDPRRFDLIETMGFDPHQGIGELERHLNRLKKSADALGFGFDRHHARNELQAATFRAGPSIVRLLLSPTGVMAIELRPFPTPRQEPVTVELRPRSVSGRDFRLFHKTTDRSFYEEPRVASGAFEILFTDEDNFLTEGSFTTLFIERGGRLLTPPLERGLLPGILRERLIEEGRAEEADLCPEDLEAGFLIGNSARGLIQAELRRARG